jgi:AcrR family transcriptional regulator
MLQTARFNVSQTHMNANSPKRAYRQSARALAAEATAERILDAFQMQMEERWFDEIRLEDIARAAGVSVQTVIRRFGTKEGLLEALQLRIAAVVSASRDVPEGDANAAVTSLIEDYEEHGDVVLRILAQEDRFPACRAVTDFGRREHRKWIAKAFAPWLRPIDPAARLQAKDALVIAGDLYVWKLVRRDMRRSISEWRAIMETMLAAAVHVAPGDLFRTEGNE